MVGTPRVLIRGIAAFLAAAFVVVGCGGGGGGSGEPAALVPKTAPAYLQVDLTPEGETSRALNEVAKTTLGIDNVGEFVTEELESAAIGGGGKLNFEEEVEPWLGEKAGLYLPGGDGEDLRDVGIVLEATDPGEAEEFLEDRVGKRDGDIGTIGDYVAFSKTKAGFEEMVKASEGEGLNESEKFKEAMDNAPEGGIGTVYVDFGGLTGGSKGSIPLAYSALLGVAGLEPGQETAVATIVPHPEGMEIDLVTESDDAIAASTDASDLLEATPADAVAGFAVSKFGQSLESKVEELNQDGIPGQMKPGQLGVALGAVGIDIESIAESFGDVAGFVKGASVGRLGGAIVMETKSPAEAGRIVSKIGSLMRAMGAFEVTAIKGAARGFSVHSPALGPKALMVGAVDKKIVISFGSESVAGAVSDQGRTLGATANFKNGKTALGSTPIYAFVDGGAVPGLVESLLKPGEGAEFNEVKPFLEKVSYLAVGSEAEGDTHTAKLIVGLAK